MGQLDEEEGQDAREGGGASRRGEAVEGGG